MIVAFFCFNFVLLAAFLVGVLILRAILEEPAIFLASKIAFVERVARRSGVPEKLVWWFTGLEKPDPPPHYSGD